MVMSRRKIQSGYGFGFTIVELLIVVVVIAIIATIATVSYNSVVRRANNTATISAVKQLRDAIGAYTTQYGEYPLEGVVISSCATTAMVCKTTSESEYSINSTFLANINKVSNLPKEVYTTSTADHTGIVYDYVEDRTFNGIRYPALLLYWLDGTAQDCKLPRVTFHATTDHDGNPVTAINTSPNKYTYAQDGIGKTLCSISLDGPIKG